MELLIEGGASVHKLLGFCKEMLSRDGDALWALEGTGRMSYALGDYQSAVVAFKTVLKKQLNDASMWEAIGAAYLGMGRLTASLKVRFLFHAIHSQVTPRRPTMEVNCFWKNLCE